MILGPVLGGAITQGLDWRWVFWLNLAIGVAGLTLQAAGFMWLATEASPHIAFAQMIAPMVIAGAGFAAAIHACAALSLLGAVAGLALPRGASRDA